MGWIGFGFYIRNLPFIIILFQNCPQCIGSSSFDSLDVFIAHMYSHSRFRFQCPKCPSKVSSRTNLQAHIRLQHKTHIFIKFRQCHICGTFQEGEQELRKHLLSHVPVVSNYIMQWTFNQRTILLLRTTATALCATATLNRTASWRFIFIHTRTRK